MAIKKLSEIFDYKFNYNIDISFILLIHSFILKIWYCILIHSIFFKMYDI